MKHINTYLLCTLIVITIISFNNTNKTVNNKDNIRQQPLFNYNTQRIEPFRSCLLYTSPSPRDLSTSRMPSSA